MSVSLNNTQWLEAFCNWVRVQQFSSCRDFGDFLSAWQELEGKFPEALIDRYCPRRRSDAERLGRSQWSIRQLVSFLKLYLQLRDTLPGQDEAGRLEWFLANRGDPFLAGEFEADAASDTVDQVVRVGDVVRVRPLGQELATVMDVDEGVYLVETYFGERLRLARADLIPEPATEPFDVPTATHVIHLPPDEVEKFDRALHGPLADEDQVAHAYTLTHSDQSGTVSITLVVTGGPDGNRVIAVVAVQRDGKERLFGPKFNARRTVCGRYVCEGGPVVVVDPA